MNTSSLLWLLMFVTAFSAMQPSPGRAEAPTRLTIIDVWPNGKMPGRGAEGAETNRFPEKTDAKRTTNISRPTLTLFSAGAPPNPVPAMVVCPGGGYQYVVVDKEGSDIAAWLNSAGITAFVLKYRAPTNREGALQDVQRSISLLRSRAKEWNIDPHRIGVMGFSAGGNLAAKASTQFNRRSYSPIDPVDRESCRPDYAVLVYPAYLDDKTGGLSPDLNLKARIPPTLIVHSADDERHVVGSKIYWAVLAGRSGKHEFKLYPTGGHGYGLRCTQDASAWPEDALRWMNRTGVLHTKP
jgi:acetyl esterase/lipase